MPFFKSLPADAGSPNVLVQHPDLHRPWPEISQAMMNWPSPLSEGEREHATRRVKLGHVGLYPQFAKPAPGQT